MGCAFRDKRNTKPLLSCDSKETNSMSDVLQFGTVTVYLGEKSGKYPDGNQVLVNGPEARVAFDTPLVANRIGPAFDDVDLVILGHVHEDHMAGLHRVPRARVQVHEGDLAAAQSWEGLGRHYGYPQATLAAMKPMLKRDFHYAPRPDATGYCDGALWELGSGVQIRAHHMPGHTAGHCVLVAENEGVAFIGDIELSSFGPYYGDGCSSLADFRRTLTRVADIDARVWVTSHHKGVITDRATFLRELDRFASRIEERSDKLCAMLAGGPQTLAGLAARRLLYPPQVDLPYVECAERNTIRFHLDELLAQGRVWEVEPARFGLV
jgi:glyoxylase-like metal-dependent hydrolase (beta-lactamase superfamily II)